ncbi:hypothetical protein B0H66DRAFT_575862 [Apodospora peruviana]|uniref:Uncharacterized protein n=1 Tax=Apodospora peruviana TaxID=516989 RepID=A0AAE0I6L8_9PEZI|nr:hypothetical protein B0H66DRAFT_575862 [Apodospora peruviana]
MVNETKSNGRATQRNKISTGLLILLAGLPESRRYVSQLLEKREAIAALEAENRQQIIDSAKIAYDSLESVVAALLLIEKGDRFLSRQSETIVEALDAAGAKFSALSAVSEENMQELGVKAGDCMELGDSAGNYITMLEARVQALNGLIPAMFEIKRSHDRVLQDKRNREHELRSQLNSAQSSVDDFGNNFLGFFDSSVMRNAEQRLRDARSSLEDNQRQQNQAADDVRRFYRVAIATRNASAAIYGLKVMVKDVSEKFDAEYKAVTDVQDAENRLCEGLLQLRNQIVAGDWTTTRDKSLQVVLRLLAADDELFQGQPQYRDVEVRIKEAIVAKMGDCAIQELVDGVTLDHEVVTDPALAY